MKSLLESIHNKQDMTKNPGDKKTSTHITYTKFKSDIENILKNNGWKILKGTIKSDNSKSVFVDKINDSISSNNVEIDRYRIHYAWKNKYGEEGEFGDRWGYTPDCTGFSLVLYIWRDPELKRPRYKFKTFELNHPVSRRNNFMLDWDETIVSKKVIPEYYDKVLSHISGIIMDFMGGFPIIDRMWDNTEGRTIQKSDFVKIKKSIFGDKISKIQRT